MAIYIYVCRDCGDIVEMVRPMRDRDSPLFCADCGGIADRTLQGQTPQAFIFGPPKHLRYKVERTKHNLATKTPETN